MSDAREIAEGLTPNMRRALKAICADPDGKSIWWGWGSGCTNLTASALQRRGLVRCEFDRAKGCAGFPWSRWVAEPLGLAVRKILEDSPHAR